MSTMLTILREEDFSMAVAGVLLFFALAYGICGVIIAIFLYGRKANHDANKLTKRAQIWNVETGSMIDVTTDQGRQS